MRRKEFLVGLLLAATTVIQNLVGVLSKSTYKVDALINVYGDVIDLYGKGIYRYDSLFKATIFKGTDLAILLFVVPIFIGLLYLGFVKNNKYMKLMLLGVSLFLLYFHTSVATGAFYNQLHLLYILNFTLCFIFIIMLWEDIKKSQIKSVELFDKSYVIIIYLVFNLLALIMAWIPEVLYTTWNNTGLSFGHHYTTEATHLLDIGLIIPLIIYTIILLNSKKTGSLILIPIIIIMSGIIGVVIVTQTIYQLKEGVILTNQEIATKVIPFVFNSVYSLIILRYFTKRVEIGSINE